MRVFIAGATGVLGRRLVGELAGRGHDVVGLSRGERGDRRVLEGGGTPVRADLFDRAALARAAEGAEAVVHAATSIPTKARPRPDDFRENDRIRIEGTRALADAAAAVGARTLVLESVVWLAAPPDGAAFDESSPVHPGPATRSAVEAEKIVVEAAQEHGLEAAVLRCGWFYAADAAHTRALGEGLAARRVPVIGRGDAAWAPIHVDDAAAAFAAAVEEGRSGLWHVVDDRPVRAARFLDDFAELLHAPRPRRVPRWLARILAGNYLVDFLTRSVRTSNRRIREELGWAPRYPEWRDGLQAVVAEWRRDGFPDERQSPE